MDLISKTVPVASSQGELACWAVQAAHPGGREHLENAHPYRSDFQRDRDRIVHSRAFRRLEYKTQVFLNGTGDHYRTRLTHTIEVASVSRTLARALRLNEDLAECIALAHDLGHSPFGHAGENALNELMIWHGGFEHNLQSLRVVEELEIKYPEFNGLNLTWEVRDALRKRGADDGEAEERLGFKPLQHSLEAQVVDLADEMTYSCHDLDDGLDAELFSLEALAEVPIWSEVEGGILKRYSKLEPLRRRGFAVRCLLDRLVDDLCETTLERLTNLEDGDALAVRRSALPLVGFSVATRDALQQLRDFLFEKFYHHAVVEGMSRRGMNMIEQLFEAFTRNPSLMGAQAVRRIKKDGVQRAACDYLAGMTDLYARQQFEALIGEGDLMAGLQPRNLW